jgi:nucleotide-binding universal stress UspA family protein
MTVGAVLRSDGCINTLTRRHPHVHLPTVAARPGAMVVVDRAEADHLARPVVVGVDGSSTAAHAALWAVDEAVSRDIPLRLVSVIDPVGISGAHADAVQDASARAALYDVRRAIEATGKPVKIETQILRGKPLAALIEQSLWAGMVCVGSIGLKHACDGEGPPAARLAALAPCPVAVIRRPVDRPATSRVGAIVVDVHNGVVLRHALEEARLRGAPLRAISVSRTESLCSVGDRNRLAQAQLNRRIARWTPLYPDVQIETTIVRGSVCRYLATNADSVQLFVADPQAYRDLRKGNDAGCSVLTVRCTNL